MTRWVELRRHSFTKKGLRRGTGSHLSQEGVIAARLAGTSLPDVGYVVVSESPRTMETAIAMGFAVDLVGDINSAIVSGEVAFHEWWEWPNPFEVFKQRMAEKPLLASFAADQVAILQDAAEHVDDGQTALLIGHGGWIEPTLVTAVDETDYPDWGVSFSHLEGVRLAYENGVFRLQRFIRQDHASHAKGSDEPPADFIEFLKNGPCTDDLDLTRPIDYGRELDLEG